MPRRPLSRPARHVAARGPAAALRRAADRLDLEARAARCTREVSLTLAAVLLVGVGAAGADTTAPRPDVAAAPAAVAASPEPTPARPASQALADRVPDLSSAPAAPPKAPAPRPVAQPAPAEPPARIERWLPTGTGMWLHKWRESESGHAPAVVARAQKVGLSHLYVQTGSTRLGWIGDEVLNQLMPATAGTDIKVIAWDFPKLIDPEADARRLARAAWWNRKGAPMIAAVAPDVETAAEGTNLGGDRVRRYYAELRRTLPARTAILATVPWPSEKRTGSYPYATTAPYSDAFIPMAYWYNRSPSVVTATSMRWLQRFGLPVMPVGQGYDGRLDAPYLKPDPAPDKSVAAFIYNARANGAQSLSLWSWQTTGALQWGELAKAAGTVGPKKALSEPAPAPAVAEPAPAEEATPAEEPKKDKPQRKAPGRERGQRAPAAD